MRIIGYIEHPVLKITVFKMDNKLSIKMESGMYEQTYKFRESDEISNLEDIQAFVDETFINAVLAQISNMHQLKIATMERFLPADEQEEFDEII